MRKDHHTARRLRLQGRSYNEIWRILGVPKSTLSEWFINLPLPPEAKARIAKRTRHGALQGLLRRNRNQTVLAQQRAHQVRSDAARQIPHLSSRELLIIGATLYWAEGYKRPNVRQGREVTHHAVSLTNSDPLLVKIFLRFLREYCHVPDEKIKADLRIFPHQQSGAIQRYWESQTGIEANNFTRVHTVVSLSSRGKRPFHRLPFGVIQIRVADTHLFHTIMGYIEGIKKMV
ncbi:MAG: hypothetical protein PHI63_04840 [Patescibacteria group bacterium]|nr:hypothetical protein [Patescibacteria group bacterium]